MSNFVEKDIIAIFYAAESGIRDIVCAKYDELLKYYKKEFLDSILDKSLQNSIKYDNLKEHILAYGFEKKDLISVENGGILAALYEYAKEFNRGLKIRIKDVPLSQACVEICEHFSINPYRLKSKMLILIGSTTYSFIESLKDLNIAVAHIGYLTENKDKIIIDKEEIQYIDKPTKDEIYKVL